MKNFGLLTFLLLTTSLLRAQLNNKPLEYYLQRVPFNMPKVQAPTFKNQVYNIKEFGAVADGKTLNTQAIQNAINTCHQKGGGKVVVPKGTWLTAALELLSNVNLVVEKEGILQFTPDRTQYPIIKAGKKSNTLQTAAPIYAYSAENIGITGEGIIDGAGESWRPVKKSKVSQAYWEQLIKTGVVSNDGKVWWPSADALYGEETVKKLKDAKSNNPNDYLPARDFLRPHMVFFVDCNNILIEGITLRNSPKFVFYPSKCTNITIKNANVFNEWWAQNGDGIDISASKNVIIYNTTVSCGDDAICMKSSGTPSETGANLENVVIANCTVYRGHGGFVIGSNTDGGMQNIFVTNCYFNGTDIGIRVKSNSGRGGKVHKIFIDSIEMDNIKEEAILFDTYYEDVTAGKNKTDVTTTTKDKIPEFTNFTITNINCKKAALGIYINGLEEMPVHNISLQNVTLIANRDAEIKFAKNIMAQNINFKNKKPKIVLKNTEAIIFNNEEIK